MPDLTRRKILASAAATAAVAAMPVAAAIAAVEEAPAKRTILHAMRDMDRLLDEERRLFTERWMRHCWVHYLQNREIDAETRDQLEDTLWVHPPRYVMPVVDRETV
jgi:hypothetical protein